MKRKQFIKWSAAASLLPGLVKTGNEIRREQDFKKPVITKSGPNIRIYSDQKSNGL
jgi:glutathionylspermidine synthase